MRVLLTNDDGFDAIGIRLIYNYLKKNHDVTIVAPKYHQSGASSSLSIRKPLVLNLEEEGIYSLTGTPSDCVKFALRQMNLDVDLVISGINNGYNIGHDVNYSGTVGAVIEGNFLKKKTLAISTTPNDFSLTNEALDLIFSYIEKNDLLSKEYILNVNFPKVLNGIKETFIYEASHEDKYTFKEGAYYLDGDFNEVALVGSDIHALEEGYISISKLISIKSI